MQQCGPGRAGGHTCAAFQSAMGCRISRDKPPRGRVGRARGSVGAHGAAGGGEGRSDGARAWEGGRPTGPVILGRGARLRVTSRAGAGILAGTPRPAVARCGTPARTRGVARASVWARARTGEWGTGRQRGACSDGNRRWVMRRSTFLGEYVRDDQGGQTRPGSGVRALATGTGREWYAPLARYGVLEMGCGWARIYRRRLPCLARRPSPSLPLPVCPPPRWRPRPDPSHTPSSPAPRTTATTPTMTPHAAHDRTLLALTAITTNFPAPTATHPSLYPPRQDAPQPSPIFTGTLPLSAPHWHAPDSPSLMSSSGSSY